MKKLLKHALLICAGLSAGALYAPDMPAATTPNDHRWWTIGTISQLVDSLDLAIDMCNSHTRSSTNLFINKVVALVPKGSFSLKQLYHTMLSETENKKTSASSLKQLYHTMLSETANKKTSASNVAGSTHAVLIIKKLANENGLVIKLNDNDFTPKTVKDPEWWSVHYPAANRHISHITQKQLPVQQLSCRGLRMIVAQMNQGNQSLDQALKDVRATTTKNNQAQISALNGAERIIKAAQKLAQEHSKKRPVPSLVLPALALNSTVARAPISRASCSYPSSSAAAPTERSRTLGMRANPQDQKEDDPHTPKPTPFPPPLEPTRPLLEPTQPLLESELVKSELPELLASEWDHILGRWKNTLAPCIDAEDKAKLFPAPPAKRQRTGGG